MRAEYFDLTLTVPVVVRFLCAGLRGVFFAPGGRMRAAGLLRVGLCARLSQRRGRAGARGGRSASRAKAPGTSPGASFLSPLSLAIQRKGAQGRRGRAAPEDWRGDSRRSALRRRQNSRKRCGTRSVLRYDTRSIATRHAQYRDAARHVATNAREPARADTRGWAGNFRPAPTASPQPRAQ